LASGPPVECPTEVAPPSDAREAMYRRAIAFLRGGDPNVGAFKDAVILKTFGEVPTISNGSDRMWQGAKESTAGADSIASFPIRSCCLRSDACA
jgi:hypothetical protein